ncbi:MAG: hypothetical protein AAF633_05535 [Chloroflexota bacterium]
MGRNPHLSSFVGREQAIDIFSDLLLDHSQAKILLLEAPSGMGKTALIQNFSDLSNRLGYITLSYNFQLIANAHPLYLVGQTHWQMQKRMPPVYFQELTATLQRLTYHDEIRVGLDVNGEIQMVRVNLILLRANLMLMEESEMMALVSSIGIDPKHLVGKSKGDRVSLLIKIANRNYLLSDLIAAGQKAIPGVSWWQRNEARPIQTPQDDQVEWKLRASGSHARQQAMVEVNMALRESLTFIQQERKVVVFIDGTEHLRPNLWEWVESNFLYPIWKNQFPKIILVLAGQHIPSFRIPRRFVEYIALHPLSREEILEYLIHQDVIHHIDVEETIMQTGGHPLLLSSWVDAHRT